MAKLSRRKFIETAVKTGAALPVAMAAGRLLGGGKPNLAVAAESNGIFFVKEEMFYDKLNEKKIKCRICPRECVVGDQERGYCGNKENRGGKYYTLAYGNPCAAHNDPIEKKPLFHFLPGTEAFSIACAGCNFDCKFCQNWDISQRRPEQTQNYKLPPADVSAYTKQVGAKVIAYTYSEPVVYYRYMYDCAVEGKRNGLRNVMITNGYIKEKPMRELVKYLDAVKIDFKAFTDKFYKETCAGTLQPVLNTMKLLVSMGKWLELVYLIVPTLNDKSSEFRSMAKWIMKNLGPNVPIHFSRFQPMYKLKNLQPTPLSTIDSARNICMSEGLHYVYIGNVPGHAGENTYCPSCKKIVIGRTGFTVTENNIAKSKCRFCGTKIAGVWS